MYISHTDAAGAEAAKLKVEALTEEVKVGKVYDGKVTSIKDFGAFIEILPGRDGLCHISELDDKYVGKVEDVCKVGDRMQVKVIAIDEHDRVKLSRKALLREQNGRRGRRAAAGRRRAPPRGRRRGDGRRDGGGERRGRRGDGRPPRRGRRRGRAAADAPAMSRDARQPRRGSALQR